MKDVGYFCQSCRKRQGFFLGTVNEALLITADSVDIKYRPSIFWLNTSCKKHSVLNIIKLQKKILVILVVSPSVTTYN